MAYEAPQLELIEINPEDIVRTNSDPDNIVPA